MSASGMAAGRAASEHAAACFVRACALDVAVRKPGNVSIASAGHGMQATQFTASARAAVGPLFRAGARVGERIEAAVDASWAVANCNTNLGILLLCAPIAAAVERRPDANDAPSLFAAVDSVLASLDHADAQAAYRAIARANPGGLGAVSSEDVRHPPTLDLRAAMALAARRDSIARAYRDGFASLFEVGLAALGEGFVLMPSEGSADRPDAVTTAAVQRLYLQLLSRFADSHIVRIHGEAVAHSVMAAAQGWLRLANQGRTLDDDPAFVAWDQALKAARINPGTTADLTVATLLIAGRLAAR